MPESYLQIDRIGKLYTAVLGARDHVLDAHRGQGATDLFAWPRGAKLVDGGHGGN